jgi:starch phosphorylase
MIEANGTERELNEKHADALAELALNLRWSWNHAADKLWRTLDSELWESTQNPWVILQTVSRDKIKASLAQPGFRQLLDDLLRENREALSAESWFQKNHSASPLSLTAYFSMEFMLSEALPIYSGGLGNVAGDQMKAASNLGVPVVGVGLLYGQGYSRQEFDAQGWARSLFPVNDPGQLPIRPLRKPNGEWLRLRVQLSRGDLWLRCWEVSVGRNRLYLLDTNDFANSAATRGITSELYGGDAEMRLRQEMVLGIGGWRLLRAIGLQPEVCHLNEGHAAFAILERARSYMQDYKSPFDLALSITRAGNVFTTHTAVPAGFDRFPPDLMRKYFSHYVQDELRIPLEDLLALGRANAADASESFNMAYLAVRGSGRVNGVSKLHGQVSRRMFEPLFPGWPQEEVPIGSVTNGIHVPTWDSASSDALWTRACGKSRWHGDNSNADDIRRVAGADLWHMRSEGRKFLVDRIRQRYARQLASVYGTLADTSGLFDAQALTLGFARRFATYKRPNLLLHDRERLIRILSNSQRPVQLVLAGKAHPQDRAGQDLIKEWNDFIQRPEVRGHVVFLSDYDMSMTQELVQGVDVWINTPRRPWEACGTSGMKVLVNGGLNLSELDGWWVEAYSPEAGWAIGDGREHGDDPAWDAAEADAVYRLLENEIIPEFYDRDDNGMPVRWLGRIRESMALLTPRFSASRAIREYTEDHYLPAAKAYRERADSDGKVGAELLLWQRDIASHWHTLRFGAVTTETHDGWHHFGVQVFPGSLKPDEFRVQFYADPVTALEGSIREASIREASVIDAVTDGVETAGAIVYRADIATGRPANDYTARVTPRHNSAAVPLEASSILWQR